MWKWMFKGLHKSWPVDFKIGIKLLVCCSLICFPSQSIKSHYYSYNVWVPLSFSLNDNLLCHHRPISSLGERLSHLQWLALLRVYMLILCINKKPTFWLVQFSFLILLFSQLISAIVVSAVILVTGGEDGSPVFSSGLCYLHLRYFCMPCSIFL